MSNKQQKLTKENLLESTPESSESEVPIVTSQPKISIPTKKEQTKQTPKVETKKPQVKKAQQEEVREIVRKDSANSVQKEPAKAPQPSEQKKKKKAQKPEVNASSQNASNQNTIKPAKKQEKIVEEVKPQLVKREAPQKPIVKNQPEVKVAQKKVFEPSSDSSEESEEEALVQTSQIKKTVQKKTMHEEKVSQKISDTSPLSSKKTSFQVEEVVLETKNKKIKTSAPETQKPRTVSVTASQAPVQQVPNKTTPTAKTATAKAVPTKTPPVNTVSTNPVPSIPVHNQGKQVSAQTVPIPTKIEEGNSKLNKLHQSLKKQVSSSSEPEEEMEVEEESEEEEEEGMEVEQSEEESEKEQVEVVVKPQANKQVDKAVSTTKAPAEKPIPVERKQSVENQNNNSKPQEHAQIQNNNNQSNDRGRFSPEFEVIVAGLPFDANENQINQHFSGCSDFKYVKVMMGQDGRSRGKAFIKFSSEKGMHEALELNGSTMGGRTLIVELTEKMKSGQKNQGVNRYSMDNTQESCSILVRNLAYTVDEAKLQSVFSGCGTIKAARVCRDETGRSKGFGFIDFTSIDSAKNGIKKTNEKIDGRAITVVFSIPRDRNAPRPNNGGGFGGNRPNSGPKFSDQKKGMLTQFGGETVDL